MMEMLIVLMVLALLAAMVVPRLVGNDMRRFRLACDQVTDLLTMLAKRESLSQKPIGLSYDEEQHWLTVMVYDITPGSEGREASWRTDPALRPVKLPEVAELVEVRADGDRIDIARWPLTTTPGQKRPAIEIVLQGPDYETVMISLSPHAVAPRRYSDEGDAAAAHHVPIDLSMGGRSREEW